MNWDNLGNLLKAGVFSSRKASILILRQQQLEMELKLRMTQVINEYI